MKKFRKILVFEGKKKNECRHVALLYEDGTKTVAHGKKHITK